MESTTNGTTSKDYINQLYDSQISKEKEALTQTYNESISNLDANKEAAEKQKQKDLTATAVEAQRAQKNYNEVQSAYGLTSGAMAQARLAQDNQLQADMTAIRTAAADQDAAIERQRSLLSQQYASAIREAQANNDLARAQALYQLAKEEEEALQQKQLAAAYSAAAGKGNTAPESLTPQQALDKAKTGAEKSVIIGAAGLDLLKENSPVDAQAAVNSAILGVMPGLGMLKGNAAKPSGTAALVGTAAAAIPDKLLQMLYFGE